MLKYWPIKIIIFFIICPYNSLRGGQLSNSIKPDIKIQETIRSAIYFPKEKVGKKALDNLDELSRTKPDVLASQVIYFNLHVDNEKEAWGVLGIMKILRDNRGQEIREGLIPLLENKDEKIYNIVVSWLTGIDTFIDNFNLLTPDFNLGYYSKTILKKKGAPPSGLVKYVFGLSNSKALLLFGEIYSENLKNGEAPRDLMWSDHVIQTIKWRIRNRFLQEGDLEKAQKELDWLSKHEGWYARRYVVGIIRNIPKLGTPAIIHRLKNDPHPLVSEPARKLR